MVSTFMILIGHEIIGRDTSNDFEEIFSASIVVRGLTLSLVRSEQYTGRAKNKYYTSDIFREEAPHPLGGQKTPVDGMLSVLVVENDLGLYLLAVESTDPSRGLGEFKLTMDAYVPEEYTALAAYRTPMRPLPAFRNLFIVSFSSLLELRSPATCLLMRGLA